MDSLLIGAVGAIVAPVSGRDDIVGALMFIVRLPVLLSTFPSLVLYGETISTYIILLWNIY
jgi:hypothetical protein